MQGTIADPRSDLDTRQMAALYPTFAYRNPNTQLWTALVSGFVYKHGSDGMRQRMFMKLLRRVLQVSEEQLKENAIFQDRIQGFVAEPQRARNVVVRIGNRDATRLRQSKRNGQFRGHDRFSDHEIQRLQNPGQASIPFELVMPTDDDRRFEGEIQVIPPRGVSVISDIDDTIKISQVAHRQQLLHNTFLFPFLAVPGMSELYQKWQKQGAVFHYVSSSPWQLFKPLNELLSEHRFPTGSFHLRSIRFGDASVLRLFVSRKRSKYHVIRTLFGLFPERRFVLVGDSGEKDPEIYGSIARKYPQQIERILIRRVEGRKWTRKRVDKAFRRIPRELWQTFRVPTQVRSIDLKP